MKVLMFGWEFPPNNRGGLGTACFGMTKALAKKGIKITFVLPRFSGNHEHLDILTTEGLVITDKRFKVKYIGSPLMPYMTSGEYDYEYRSNNLKSIATSGGDLYGSTLFQEVERYADKARLIARFENFDVIHCHDWMTFKAGMIAKKASGKPLVVHIHATDFDRTGGNPDQRVYDTEREGMHAADKVVAVSGYTKGMIVEHYGIAPEKVVVMHNGVDEGEPKKVYVKDDGSKIVLFLGRLTLQKGPEYFLESAKKVLDILPDTKFVMAGAGDMYPQLVNRAIELGMSRNVLFTGHLTGQDINAAYQMADLYVMPSVSEPFGITPLESLKNQTPVIISKQSGVSEVLPNALKVDFWDIEEMANKIVSVLSYGALKSTLAERGEEDAKRNNWNAWAGKCIKLYKEVAA